MSDEKIRLGGMALANGVRLNYYTTNVAAFMEVSPTIGSRLHSAGCQPAAVLLGVAALFHPDILVEIEATAVVPA